MDLRQLRYFVTIADEGQILAASKKLNIAQPPLSQSLKNLEEELGVKLIERGSRKISLTEEGKLLRTRAEQILALADNTKRELLDAKEGFKGTLSIGTVATTGMAFLPNYIKAFHQKYPNIKFNLHEGDAKQIAEKLNNNIIEIGIVRTPFDVEAYNSKKLPSEPMVAVIPKTIKNLAVEGDISLKEIKDYLILIHYKHETIIMESCRRIGFEPNIICKGNDVRQLIILANNDIGIAIVPESAVGSLNNSNSVCRMIIEPVIELSTAIIWNRNRKLTSAASRFLDLF